MSSFIFRSAGFQEIIEQLHEINDKLGDITVLLQFLLTPPDLKNYQKGKEMKRKKIKDSI
tara:strand:- start:17463 stop:17642 length:180 start_codon:yes stop_codon:yes gene_type:complete